MTRKIFALSLIALPLLNASGNYQVDTSYPQFYFEDERDARIYVSDWAGIHHAGLGTVTLSSGSSVNYWAVPLVDHVAVKGWGIARTYNISQAQWNYNQSTNYTCTYDSQYEGAGKVYMYLHLRWFRYSLAFNASGGTPTPSALSDVCYTNSVPLGSASRTGYTFAGWTNSYNTAALTGSVDGQLLGVEEDGKTVTLYAKWTANQYTVTFNGNATGVSGVPSSKTVTYDSTYGNLAAPTRTGYTFGGWWTASSGGSQVTSATKVAITANQTLYAHWTANTYTVTLKPRNGGADTTVAAAYGSLMPSITPPVRTGFSFDGYYDKFDSGKVSGNQYYNANGVGLKAWDKTSSSPRLYAKWTAKTYTVTFNANATDAGVTPGSKDVTYGLAYGVLPEPVRAGYRSTGWYTAVSGGSIVSSTTNVMTAKDHALYAHWTASAYTVTLNPRNGGSNTTVTVTYGSPMPAIAPPVRKGYRFDGYYDRFDSTTYTVGGAQYYNANGASARTWDKASSNQKLYAKWTANQYTVTFAANASGVSVAPSSKTVTYDLAYGDLPEPVRAGYGFGGWYTASSGGNLVTSSTRFSMTANQTLYAHWTADKYTVTFDSNAAGVSVTPKTKQVAYGSTYGDLPSPTRPGYSFSGWFTAAAGGTQITPSTTVALTSAQTLYAHWTGASYTVTLKPRNGGQDTTVAATYGSLMPSITPPVRTGFSFDGYYDKFDSGKVSGSQYYNANGVSLKAWDKTSSNPKLYAKWTAKTYTVTFNANAADATVTPESKDVTYGLAYGVLPEPVRAGYRSTGWYTAASGGSTVMSTNNVMTAKDHALYAHWTGRTYKLRFHPENGEAISTNDVAYGDSAMSNVANSLPTRIGYTFDGWYNSTNYNVQVYDKYGRAVVGPYWKKVGVETVWDKAGNLDVYARWTGASYTVTLKPRNGGPDATVKAIYGQNLPEVTPPKRTGFSFDGYYDKYDSGKVSGNQYYKANGTSARTWDKALSNAKLYAKWTANQYTVTFDPNGGTVPQTTKTVTYNSAYGTLPKPTYPDHEFSGWVTDDGDVVTSTSFVGIAADHTLYAGWGNLPVTVTFIDDRNGEDVGKREVAYGGSVSVGDFPAPPLHDGYTFTSWNPNVLENLKSNITVRALYRPNTFYVKYEANGVDATGEMPVEMFTYDVVTILAKNSFSRYLYEFQGWATNAGGNVVYADCAAISNNLPDTTDGATNTLYAVWGSTLSPYSIAADCTTLDLVCTNDSQKWSIDNNTGSNSSSSVYAAGSEAILTCQTKGAGTLTFWRKCVNDSGNRQVGMFEVYVDGNSGAYDTMKDTTNNWVVYTYSNDNEKAELLFVWYFEGKPNTTCWIDQVKWEPSSSGKAGNKAAKSATNHSRLAAVGQNTAGLTAADVSQEIRITGFTVPNPPMAHIEATASPVVPEARFGLWGSSSQASGWHRIECEADCSRYQTEGVVMFDFNVGTNRFFRVKAE